MSDIKSNDNQATHVEFAAKASGGMLVLLLISILEIATIAVFVFGITVAANYDEDGRMLHANSLPLELGVTLIIVGALLAFIIVPFFYVGLKVVRPNEARVLTLFGRYMGTLRNDGFYYVNPFITTVKVWNDYASSPLQPQSESSKKNEVKTGYTTNKISLKTLTLTNSQQKINDLLGNPIIISIVVIWRVIDTAKAVFDVDNYQEFLSVQSDSALRNIVRKYPYDSTDEASHSEKSLRGSSQEIAENLRQEIQSKVTVAGLEVTEARITHLAYAPEIAAAMLQRQQASAIVDARTLIVEGAVGMVEMALAKLGQNNVVDLDEERKAAMVSNLMVVLCGSKDAQPVVNSGSLY
ncbi:membrane protein [Actinomycetota bacterium]|nr:membrane protein [Actinomycetota bacterium]